jgi:acetyl-CoA synthetase
VLLVPDPSAYAAAPLPYADLAPADDCLLTFTSGTAGPPKAVVHGQRYLSGQTLQAEHWLGADPDDVVWCTAGTGWSKSARNSFIAGWLCGARVLLHDARFDPTERLAIAAEEAVTVWCMAPTEYRVIAAQATVPRMPTVRSLVAAGEALDPSTLATWQAATGVAIRDGYGQTETGQLTANPVGVPARPGSMGRPLPGVHCEIVDGELVVDPTTVPTFFLRYLGEPVPTGPWHTGDRVTQDADGYLHFVGRADDVIVSAGYRIGPFEVESVLAEHSAVAEVAVVGSPDEVRGEVVRAVVVLRPGYVASETLGAELAAHVRARTAPYKYPRVVDFVDALPKTVTGKIRRAALRQG